MGKKMRVVDILAIPSTEIVLQLVILSNHCIDIIKAAPDEKYMEPLKAEVALINLAAARILTQLRASRFLMTGIVVTNGMWFAKLMGWV